MLNKTVPEQFSHIRGLRDLIDVHFTPNPAFSEDAVSSSDISTGHACARFICPITNLDMNGQHRFSLLRTCGCVFSNRALQEVASTECLQCRTPFSKDDVIILNGTDDEVEELKIRMNDRQLLAREERKKKRQNKKEKKHTHKRKREDEDDEMDGNEEEYGEKNVEKKKPKTKKEKTESVVPVATIVIANGEKRKRDEEEEKRTSKKQKRAHQNRQLKEDVLKSIPDGVKKSIFRGPAQRVRTNETFTHYA